MTAKIIDFQQKILKKMGVQNVQNELRKQNQEDELERWDFLNYNTPLKNYMDRKRQEMEDMLEKQMKKELKEYIKKEEEETRDKTTSKINYKSFF